MAPPRPFHVLLLRVALVGAVLVWRLHVRCWSWSCAILACLFLATIFSWSGAVLIQFLCWSSVVLVCVCVYTRSSLRVFAIFGQVWLAINSRSLLLLQHTPHPCQSCSVRWQKKPGLGLPLNLVLTLRAKEELYNDSRPLKCCCRLFSCCISCQICETPAEAWRKSVMDREKKS